MTIETQRLLLRPFLETDAEDVYEYLREPAVHCFSCMKLSSVDEAKSEMHKRAGEKCLKTTEKVQKWIAISAGLCYDTLEVE